MADVFAKIPGAAPTGFRPGMQLSIKTDPDAGGGIDNTRVHLKLGDHELKSVLIQQLALQLDANNCLPQLSITLIPGALDVLIDSSVLSLREACSLYQHQFAFDPEDLMKTCCAAPFPVTVDELMVVIEHFRRCHDDTMPTHVHVSEEMWNVIKWRLTRVSDMPEKLLGMTVVRDAPAFRLTKEG